MDKKWKQHWKEVVESQESENRKREEKEARIAENKFKKQQNLG